MPGVPGPGLDPVREDTRRDVTAERADVINRLLELDAALDRHGYRRRGTEWERLILAERERTRLALDRIDGAPPVVMYDPRNDELYRGLFDDEADEAAPRRGIRLRGRSL